MWPCCVKSNDVTENGLSGLASLLINARFLIFNFSPMDSPAHESDVVSKSLLISAKGDIVQKALNYIALPRRKPNASQVQKVTINAKILFATI